MQEEKNQMVEQAKQEERGRVREICGVCKQFEMDATRFIASGASMEEVRTEILKELGEKRKPSAISVTADGADKFRAAATDGLAMRAGIAIEKPAAGAENFQGKSLLRLASECLEREGQSHLKTMADEELVRAAFTGSSAFPGILSNVAHKSMAQSYQSAPTTYQHWTAKGSNADFKAATRYRLSEADELLPMTESGEFKDAVIAENSVKAVVATFGRAFSITRKAIIDDDLGALSRIPSLYGMAARRGINKLVYEVLKKNPSIEGEVLFHASHNNLTKEQFPSRA